MNKTNNLNKTVMIEIKFGNINMKLDNIMIKRNISTYELSSKANVRFQK